MIVEIFEQTGFPIKSSDLDLMINYIVDFLIKKGITIKRYDKLIDEDKFDRVKGYALPVIMVDNEIVSAGYYDFSSINFENFNLNNSLGCTLNKCNSCPEKKFCKSSTN